MTTQTQKPITIFPDLPRQAKVLDPDGTWSQIHQSFFDQVVNQLQQHFKNEGFLFPPLTASDLATILAPYTALTGQPLPQNQPGNAQQFLPDLSGQMVFDSTNRVPKMFIITYDGATPPNIVTVAWKTFTLT